MSGHQLVRRKMQYRVDGSSSVWLTVTIGDGQPGSIDLYLAGQEPVVLESGRRNRIGDGSTGLKSSIANVVCMVRDLRTETNWTSIQIDLEGGVEPASFPLSQEADRDKGYVMYDIDIEFV